MNLAMHRRCDEFPRHLVAYLGTRSPLQLGRRTRATTALKTTNTPPCPVHIPTTIICHVSSQSTRLRSQTVVCLTASGRGQGTSLGVLCTWPLSDGWTTSLRHPSGDEDLTTTGMTRVQPPQPHPPRLQSERVLHSRSHPQMSPFTPTHWTTGVGQTGRSVNAQCDRQHPTSPRSSGFGKTCRGTWWTATPTRMTFRKSLSLIAARAVGRRMDVVRLSRG